MDIEDLDMILIENDENETFSSFERVDTFRESLLKWYDLNRRKLPWRGDESITGVQDVLSPKKKNVVKQNEQEQQRRVEPYATWVSEIMCQQTRVETVVPYYLRWMKRFPNVATLSKASDEEVNKAWVGLGYYRRARLLRNGAKYVMEHGGKVPDTVEELLKIPGIGPYTAGAIASIAFARHRPLVDGNVIRVLSRLRALAGNTKSVKLKKKCWSVAETLVSKNGTSFSRPGDFNQALMELGATVCSPKSPKCEMCPVQSHCRAYAELHNESRKVLNCTASEIELNLARKRASTVEKYPLPSIKAKPRPQNRVVAVVRDVRALKSLFSFTYSEY